LARITIEDCTEQIPNHFTLVLMTSIRTKQLKRGAKPQVSPGENRAVVTALREIAAGVVQTDDSKPE
jgi:DNA-directed RNA polymerase subunit omega